MPTLFDPAVAKDVRNRIAAVPSDSPRQWGKMNLAQALAHCSAALDIAVGDSSPPRMMIGRFLGWLIKPLALGNDKPMAKNSPTVPSLVIANERDVDAERQRLLALFDRFVGAGPAGCTKNPHAFFGRLTPVEWGTLSYKHLDHHLRQFSA